VKKHFALLLGGLYLLSGCGSGGTSTGSSGGGLVTRFSISSSVASVSAGTPFSVTVQALNSSGAIVSSYMGTVHFTSSESPAVLPKDSTLIAGTQTFSGVILEAVGNQTITATDTVDSSITGTSPQISVTGSQGLLSITSGTPPNGQVGVTYNGRQGPSCKQGSPYCSCVYIIGRGYVCHLFLYGFPLSASGGVPPYTWTWAPADGSSLPPGLTIAPVYTPSGDTPAIAGSPSFAGNYQVIVTVTDSASPPAQASADYPISIAPPPPPVIDTTNSPGPGANLPYSFTFTAHNGQPPLTWSVKGSLPLGFTLSSNGVFAGTTSQTGTFPVTVTVLDSAGQSNTQDFNIQVFPDGFTSTGSMASTRFAFTATSLSTDNVLIAGGQDNTGPTLATAELYDPASGSFSSTGTMAFERTWHTATTCNGQVLVAGGFDGSDNALGSAELYDPATGIFSLTGAMATGRVFHTAALVSGGKVLVAGGWDESRTPQSSAEVYDPGVGTFSATGSMQSPRVNHTATVLPNGQVLIAGGVDANGNVLASTELYDPKSGTFSATGSMATARFFHQAILLNNGQVLVTGGFDFSDQAIAAAELYDPNTGTFASAGNEATARAIHTELLLNNGNVLLAGGGGVNGILTGAEVFNPDTGQFTATGGLQTPRFGQASTMLGNGKAIVLGGGNAAANALATAEIYQ